MQSTKCSIRSSIVLSAAVVTLCCLVQEGVCQASNDAADLVVSGRVAKVFRSDSSEEEFLVQILVQKSEATNMNRTARAVRFPAPGEYVYAHIVQSGLTEVRLPRSNTNIRATLSAGDRQQWTGRGRTWFKEVEGDSTVSDKSDGDFGVSTTQISLRFRRALKVTAVDANSPASRAGIEVGDVLVSANGEDINSPEQLAEQIRKSRGKIKLTIRDIRSDKNVPIEVDLNGRAGVPRNTRRVAKRESGLKTEVAFFSGNAVLKVVEVAAGSPAKQAGIRPGLLILTADGDSVSKPESLTSAEARSNGAVMLKLYDPKTRKESMIRVDLR